MDTEKRKRIKNFSEYEKNLLLELLKKYPIVLSKDKSTKTNNAKIEARTEVEKEFNGDAQVTQRDISSLKISVANLTAKAKKDLAEHKRETNKTGGGPAPP